MFGPANLPPPIVDKVRAEVARILRTPEASKLFESNTFELIEKSPEQFVQFIRDDLDNWARQIKAAGIKPD
jgi:tripartite-type tricarboxylate transporter receptor subunit TctC